MMNSGGNNHMDSQRRQIIIDVAGILKQRYAGDATGHDWLHLERVWDMAKKLAEGQPVDGFVVEMAALLHDVDDFKFKKPGEGQMAQIKAIVERYEIDESAKNLIYEIASHVSFKGGGVPDNQPTLEGQIVQDADRLDALGAIGISRTFVYNGAKGAPVYDPAMKPDPHKTEAEYVNLKSTAINHFYEKLLLLKDRLHTAKARQIAEKRHKFMQDFLDEFWAETKGER
jgi:uncharacterized protein